MTQASGFWDTTGTGDGSASGYTETQLYVLFRALFLSDPTNEGVLKNYLNALAVSGVASPLDVATGGALVAGLWYVNDAAATIAVPTPAGATRIDRIVLTADWTAQTVRIARVAGSEGGAAPALTQSLGTTWQVSLAQASITTGGVITVTDQRVFAHFNTEVETAMIGDSQVTTAKIADEAVTSAKLEASIEFGTANIADDAVTNAKLANMTRGTVKVGGASDAPTDLDANNSGYILVGDGTDLVSVAVSGDVTLAANGAVTIAAGVVETAMIADGNVTQAKLGSDTLQQLCYMLLQETVAASSSWAYTGQYNHVIYIDKDDLPAGATVKLFGYVTGAGGDQEVKLLTVAGADVTGASFGATGTTVFDISSDFAANLSSGNTAYTIQHRYTGSSGSTHSVGLIIEW